MQLVRVTKISMVILISTSCVYNTIQNHLLKKEVEFQRKHMISLTKIAEKLTDNQVHISNYQENNIFLYHKLRIFFNKLNENNLRCIEYGKLIEGKCNAD